MRTINTHALSVFMMATSCSATLADGAEMASQLAHTQRTTLGAPDAPLEH